jgi:hypothetical protein
MIAVSDIGRIWHASGIIPGAGILGLLALFEKRRGGLLYVIDGLKNGIKHIGTWAAFAVAFIECLID